MLVVALEALGDFDRPDSLLKLVELLLLGQEGELECCGLSLCFTKGSGQLGFASVGCGSKAEPNVAYGGGVVRVLDQDLAGCPGGDGRVWSVDFGGGLSG